ncbi:MAG: kinase/pyrophosphorylase [Bacteroidetes bacterium]|nr:kinase/pyrophosphorylase [Bacteroidota bacterium]
MNSSEPVTPHIYVVSGGKGLAGDAVVKSLLVQYPNHRIPVTIVPDILTEAGAQNTVNEARINNGVIVHTMVDRHMRNTMNKYCTEMNVPSFDLMGDLSDYLSDKLQTEPINQPGLFRKLNQEYFDRIKAIEFTLNTDDGMNPDRLYHSDIVLTGISRTGKTPLSIYLAMFGWKVANIPLVNKIPPPEELYKVDPRRVFGLTISMNTLIEQRRRRVANMGNFDHRSYLDPSEIIIELEYSSKIFRRGGFTTVDVTNKPIESSANEIVKLINERFDLMERKIDKD